MIGVAIFDEAGEGSGRGLELPGLGELIRSAHRVRSAQRHQTSAALLRAQQRAASPSSGRRPECDVRTWLFVRLVAARSDAKRRNPGSAVSRIPQRTDDRVPALRALACVRRCFLAPYAERDLVLAGVSAWGLRASFSKRFCKGSWVQIGELEIQLPSARIC